MHRRSPLPLVAALIAAACILLPAAAAGAPGLAATISADALTIAADEPVAVRLTLTNQTSAPIPVPVWDTPARGIHAPVFQVTRDGAVVAYTGPLGKRAPAAPADTVEVPAGESRSWAVDLASAWAFTQGGEYSVRFAGSPVVSTNTVRLHVAARAATGPAGRSAIVRPRTAGRTITVTGCTSGQETQARAAVTNADAYAATAVAYFDAYRAGQRYTTWFGTYAAPRWNTAAAHFDLIHEVTSTRDITLECASIADCGGTGTFAFVYPSQPYAIYLCSAFWSAGATGTDSRAGTLIHEISHFTVVAGTDDHVYGQVGAASLASTNPGQAVTNADNHEYFAEDTPTTSDTGAAYTLSRTALDFGATRVGETRTEAFTLTSTGGGPVTITALAASDPEFTVVNDTCSGQAVAPAATCQVTLRFTPAGAGTRSAQVSIAADAPASVGTVQLTATGEAPAAAPQREQPQQLAAPPAATPAAAAAPAWPARPRTTPIRLRLRAVVAPRRLAAAAGLRVPQGATVRVRPSRTAGMLTPAGLRITRPGTHRVTVTVTPRGGTPTTGVATIIAR